MATKIIAGKPTELDDRMFIYPETSKEGVFRLYAVRGASKQILMNIDPETLTMRFVPNDIIHFEEEDQ